MNKSFFSTLTLIFIILKLCNVIKWSWFLVLSPLLIVPIITILLIFLAGTITYFFDKKDKQNCKMDK